MKIVIVGAGPAALKAIETIATYRAVSREDVTTITVVSAELAAPQLSDVLGELSNW